MKKILFSQAFLMPSILFLFFACSNSNDNGSGGSPFGHAEEDVFVTAPLASHLSDKYTYDLDVLLKQKYIRVLTTINRTNFFIEEGRPYGFEYELLKKFEGLLNRKTSKKELRVVFEFIPCSRDRLIPNLIEGYGDIIAAGLTVTPGRSRIADFTDPYLSGIDQVAVIYKKADAPQKPDDLSGKEVLVRKSSSYYETLIDFNQKLKKSGKNPVIIVPADENLETEDILELVNSGAVEMTVCDSHIASIWSEVFKNISVLNDIKLRSGDKIAWMVRKENPLLKAKLNEFLKTHKQGTLIGNVFFNRYYKKTKWIENPLKNIDDDHNKNCCRLIKKYSKQYGFDWMFIMALAYQESGLDNSKKSSAGAVGIMQIKPETAEDKNIGIKNVHKLENNVHAGIKYLAFLRDRYFNKPEIRPRDQVRFAMAAYNAGPAKIQRARKMALEMGLDQNRWFRNVELAVLKLVGRETVSYVSKINKYYIIYRIAEKHIAERKNTKAVISQ